MENRTCVQIEKKAPLAKKCGCNNTLAKLDISDPFDR